MNLLEWLAAALGIVNVALVVRRSIWNYPFGIAMVSLYFFVFCEAKLYSDALLQIFFLVIQLYGWWNWRRARNEDGVPVGTMSGGARAAWLIGTGAAIAGWGAFMAAYTDAAAPMVDAGIAGASVTAQILQSLRRVESWVFWIAVDVVAIGLFASRGLYVTSVLYALFLLLASAGLLSWIKASRRSAAA